MSKPKDADGLRERERNALRIDHTSPIDPMLLGRLRAKVRNLHMEHPDRRLVAKVCAKYAEKEPPKPAEGTADAMKRGAARAREHIEKNKPEPFRLDPEGVDAA